MRLSRQDLMRINTAQQEVLEAHSKVLAVHGERLKKIEEWVMHNVDQGLIVPPWKTKLKDETDA